MTELRDQLQQTLGDSYRLEQELGDAYGGADMLGMKADVLVLLGEEEAAISVFERLLAIPTGSRQLWLLSDYASLRDNPRFRRLVNH